MTKILVVEDDAMNAEIATRMLRANGYEVAVAANGPAGVAAALADRPALILMDLGLPLPEDGLRATRQIRAQAGTEQIPIIAFTARSMSSDVEEAYAAGCNDFESKPIDFKRLLGKIQALLPPRTDP